VVASSSQSGEPGPVTAHLRRDASGFIVAASPEITDLLGWEPDEIVGTSSTRQIHPTDQAGAIAAWMDMIDRPGHPHRWRGRYRTADDRWVWVETINTNRLDDPEFGVVLTVMRAITTGDLSIGEQLRDREQLLDRLAEALPVGVVQFDADRSVQLTNARLHAIIGGDGARRLADLFAAVLDDDRADLERAFAAALTGRLVDNIEIRFSGPGPASTVCSLNLRPLTGVADEVTGAVATVDDVTDRVRLRRQLQIRASTDELTDCVNRRAILSLLEDGLASLDGGRGVAALLVDLADLGRINDRFGEDVGDEVLAATAERLRGAIRRADEVGRFGGDVFLVFCPAVTDAEAAAAIAARVDAAVNRAVDRPEGSIPVLARVGVAFTTEPVPVGELISGAAEARGRSVGVRRVSPWLAPRRVVEPAP
jgi:diguanylate cyclase (GGDEF)-like protein/PAS domain S-box-containing protein